MIGTSDQSFFSSSVFSSDPNKCCVPEEGAYLGADVPQRSNCDKAPTNNTWGEELLELCRSTELLIVNGWTPGTFQGDSPSPALRGKV